MNHPFLIDTETLQQNLGRPGLVVLDVRGRAAYEFGGHIPGAVHSTWHEYSDPKAVAKGLIDPDPLHLEQKIRALGINDESDVVIYSNPFDNWGDEGRMFWMLHALGHQHLRVLDGGWVKWVEERRPFAHGPVRVAPGNFRVQPRAGVSILKDELKQIVKSPDAKKVAILDARSYEEFLGKEVSGIPRPGHIPGAIPVPWNGFLNKDGTLKPAETILQRLAAQQMHPHEDTVVYCTGGVRSAWLWFVLKVAGFERVRNYAGSWWEWSRDFACPVEKDTKMLQELLELDQAGEQGAGSGQGKPGASGKIPRPA